MNVFKSFENRLVDTLRPLKGPVAMLSICLAAIFAALTLGGCDMREVGAAADVNTRKENNMESMQTTTILPDKIPPIDAAASPTTETATFAMG